MPAVADDATEALVLRVATILKKEAMRGLRC